MPVEIIGSNQAAPASKGGTNIRKHGKDSTVSGCCYSRPAMASLDR